MFGGEDLPILQEVEDASTDTQGEKDGGNAQSPIGFTGVTTSRAGSDTLKTLEAFIVESVTDEGILNDQTILNDILFTGKDPMWPGHEGDDLQIIGSGDVNEVNAKVDEEAKSFTKEDGTHQEDPPKDAKTYMSPSPSLLDCIDDFLRDLEDSEDFQPPPEVDLVGKDEIGGLVGTSSHPQAVDGGMTQLVLENNARNFELAQKFSVPPAEKAPEKQGVSNVKLETDHIALVPDCDDGFDELIEDPKPSLARRKRPRPIDKAIPSMVAELYSEEDDCVDVFCSSEQPNSQTVTFRSSGKAVAFSCAPDATGKDLKHVVKAHHVLEKLDLVSIDSYMFYTDGRCFEDEELVVPNLVLDVVGLPSHSKRRKLDLENIKKENK